METVTRFVHTSGWFADVPTAAMAFLSPTTSTLTLDGPEVGDGVSHVVMDGIVIHSHADHSVVSCNGLLVGLPSRDTVGRHCRVVSA